MPRRISNGQSLETASAAAGIFKFPLFSTFQAHRETDSGQNETVNARRETASVHRETFNVRREGDNAQNGTFNGRRATDNGRSTTGDVCRASHSVRRETDIGRRAIGDVRRESASGRRESGNFRWRISTAGFAPRSGLFISFLHRHGRQIHHDDGLDRQPTFIWPVAALRRANPGSAATAAAVAKSPAAADTSRAAGARAARL